MTSYRIRAYMQLVVVALIWGVAGSVIKFTLRGIDPLPFLVYRFFLASILALFFLIVDYKNTRKIFDNIFQVGLFGFLAYTVGLLSLFLGVNLTTVLAASLIATIGPVIGVVLGGIFLKETITRREKVGTIIAFAGAIWVVLSPTLGGNGTFGHPLGNLLILGYVLADRSAAVWAKKVLRKKINSFTLINVGMIVAFLTITPMTLFEYSTTEIFGSVMGLTLAEHLGVVFMAFVSGTVAYTLWIRAMKSIETSEAGLFTYLSPIFATPLAVLWLGEKITPTFVIGAVIIAVGVTIAEMKKKR